VEAVALRTFPAASLATAVNFSFWPTETSGLAGVISIVFTEDAGAVAGPWAVATIGTRPDKLRMTSKVKLRIYILRANDSLKRKDMAGKRFEILVSARVRSKRLRRVY